MANIFKDIYPEATLDMSKVTISKTLTIDTTTEFNPIALSTKAFGSPNHVDVLMLVNNIRDPFKELVIGKVIIVPYLSSINTAKQVAKKFRKRSVRLKNVKTEGNKITY